MNGKKLILIILIIVAFLGAGVIFYFENSSLNNINSKYESSKVSSTNESSNSQTSNESRENNQDNTNSTNSTKNPEQNVSTDNATPNNPPATTQPQPPPQPIEEQIATFSTKIYSSDSARQNNINITCSTLDGTIVKNGEVFSFCNTVGQATTSKGYQKADIFDKYGNKKKGLGGGNCQISTTLYNALLAVPSLEVTERHEHSNYVPYIEKGKDAAVAYGSYDLKFKNNSGNDIKVLSSSDGKNVTVSLISLK